LSISQITLGKEDLKGLFFIKLKKSENEGKKTIESDLKELF